MDAGANLRIRLVVRTITGFGEFSKSFGFFFRAAAQIAHWKQRIANKQFQ